MLSNIKVGAKILGVVGICLTCTIVIASYAIYQMVQIGTELEEIAERDIPLSNSLTTVMIHQLEQAALLERALRIAQQSNSETQSDNRQLADEYETLSHLVDSEISEVGKLTEHFANEASAEETRKEFLHISSVLREIESEHRTYEQLSLQLLGLAATGELQSAGALIGQIEVQQDALVKKLESLVTEIGSFTERAALKAAQHENMAINILAALTGLIVIGGGGLAVKLVRASIIEPLAQVVSAVNALKDGDTSVKIDVTHQDEIGDVARAVDVFRQNMIEANQLSEEAEQSRQEQETRRSHVDELIKNFSESVQEKLGVVGAASDKVREVAQSMKEVASETKENVAVVAAATQESVASVEQVASAAEELSISVEEISQQVEHSGKVARNAVEKTEATNASVQELADFSKQIGDVLNLIQGIAEQTNLLALNATIEAARAGEAGKGFTVVASEVKNLAGQTAKATEEISGQITAIQNSSRGAARAIGGVTEVIRELEETTSKIVGAVSQQRDATAETTTFRRFLQEPRKSPEP